MGISWGRKMGSYFSFGANLNSLTLSPAVNNTQRSGSDPAMGSQNSMALDLGFMVELNPRARLGLSVKNLGASFGNVVEHDLDTILKFGAQVKPIDRFTLALDMNFKENIDENKENSLQINLGGEYLLTNQFAFRAGVDKGDLTTGMGFIADNWNIDYAFLNHDIGNTHRVSFTMRFGGVREDKKSYKAALDRSYAKYDESEEVSAEIASRLKIGQTLPEFTGKEVADKKGRMRMEQEAFNKMQARAGGVKKNIPAAQKSHASQKLYAAQKPSDVHKSDDIDDLFGDAGSMNAGSADAGHAQAGKGDEIDDLFGDTGALNAGSADAGHAQTARSQTAKGDEIDDLFGGPSVKQAKSVSNPISSGLGSWTPVAKNVVYSRKVIDPKKIPDHQKKMINGYLYVSLDYLAEKLDYHYSEEKLTGAVNLFKLGVFGSDEYVKFRKGSMDFEVNRRRDRLDNPVLKVGVKSALAFDDAVKVFDLKLKQ
jgi:hypothetical protein